MNKGIWNLVLSFKILKSITGCSKFRIGNKNYKRWPNVIEKHIIIIHTLEVCLYFPHSYSSYKGG